MNNECNLPNASSRTNCFSGRSRKSSKSDGLSSRSCWEVPENNLKSLVEFYDSIPEYNEINHLSNKEFYRKLQQLREKQRQFFAMQQQGGTFSFSKAESPESVAIQKPPSRRSVRIESPANETPSSILRIGSASRTKSPYCDSTTLDDLSECGTKSLPNSPRKVLWKDAEEEVINDGITIPKPFQMTVRDEENKIVDDIMKKEAKAKVESAKIDKNCELFRANPVPIESQIPLFNKIMYEQEKRRQVVKKRSKEALKSRMRLFSFTKREEEMEELTRRLSKSSPNLFQQFDEESQSKQCKKHHRFKAKPIPKNLFSNYIYRKMHEDEYYRSLQRKIRSEEMLRSASLPPSMAKREKTKPKSDICPRTYRDFYERQFLRSPSGDKYKNLDRQLAELELDYIMQTPSPKASKKCSKSQNGSKKKSKKYRKSSSSSSSKTSTRCQSALGSVNRSNLAAVLRIETARKRMEEEISRRLEEARVRDEARWREKVLRKRPVWQALAYSHEEDLNMRLQMRKEEERLRQEEHKLTMQTMLGRVNQQPTLFERQSSIFFPKTKEDLIAKLCDESQLSRRCRKRTKNDFDELVKRTDELVIGGSRDEASPLEDTNYKSNDTEDIFEKN